MTGEIFWVVQTIESEGTSAVPQPEEVFSDEELTRYREMHVPKRAQEWLLGRWTSKCLLTAPGMPLEGTDLTEITIDNLPEGAPVIKNPTVPGGLSLSHRRTLAACAYTPDEMRRVGIDLEWIEPRERSFVEDFFTFNEAAHTYTLPHALRPVWVTLVWSAKEAVLKAWRKGLRLDTRKVEISAVMEEEFLEFRQGWQPLEWTSHVEGYPDCWLGWRQWGSYILTLAYTLEEEGNPAEIVRPRRVEIAA